MNQPSIDDFEVEYARFNALKTLSTNTPSEFEHARFGDLSVTRDPARSDGYYNRILGLMPGSVDQLDQAIAWMTQGATADHEIRVDVSLSQAEIGTAINNPMIADLTSRGFRHVETLVWMHFDQRGQERPHIEPADLAPADLALANQSTQAVAVGANNVRELTKQDWPSLRRNREHEWPIDDLIWKQKRNYLCTDTFRWFGIFDGNELVSTASTWTTSATPGASNVTILGSAFTLPNYRNRGHQGQLLAARCHLVPGPLFVDVAADSASYRNCVRAGFINLDHRQLWTRGGRP